MVEEDKEDLKIAVFFDAENINPKYIPAIISELEKFGMVLFQRAYADWTLPNMQGNNWKDLISKTPITVYQQFHNGEKQVADKSIIMDAVELAIKQDNINAITIVSSDNGFYPLALRLREFKKYVIGIGEKEKLEGNQHNSLFIKSCNRFIYIEDLKVIGGELLSDESEFKDFSVQNILDQAYEICRKIDLNGKEVALVAELGASMFNLKPDLNYTRDFGKSRLLDVLKDKADIFETFQSKDSKLTWYTRKKIGLGVKGHAKLSGIIKRLISGYGIIAANDGDYYFSFSDLADSFSVANLREGTMVRFSVEKQPNPNGITSTEKNGKAINIEPDTPVAQRR